MYAPHHPPGPGRRWPFLLSLLTLLAAGPGRADQWFLKIEGIPGALTEGPFAGWTPVQNVGTLVDRPMDAATGTLGRSTFAVKLDKTFDRSSPALMQSCASGELHRRATLARVVAQPQATQYRISLDTVYVASVDHQAAGTRHETVERETIAFTFDKIEVTHFDLDANGGITGGLAARFDPSTGEGTSRLRPPFRAVIARVNGRPVLSVNWPAEQGHRYQIQGQTAPGEPWQRLLEHAAAEDGPVTQLIPLAAPTLILRVEEVE